MRQAYVYFVLMENHIAINSFDAVKCVKSKLIIFFDYNKDEDSDTCIFIISRNDISK